MGNSTDIFFLVDTSMECYYLSGLYFLPSLSPYGDCPPTSVTIPQGATGDIDATSNKSAYFGAS
jgi:hypothetical protein